jgi:hypothetical protein
LKQAVDSEDDWTGITDGATRRKKQNRLNVRAYRKSNVFHTNLRGRYVEIMDHTTRPNELPSVAIFLSMDAYEKWGWLL